VRRQQAAEKVNRTEDPNTWNWEGKPVRHVNHTLTGKPLNPRQIGMLSVHFPTQRDRTRV